MTDVVAALIWDHDRFLACQRPAYKARGLLWEFVGGKVEPGETKEQALMRECREELDVIVGVGNVFMEVTHEYPDLTVHLTLFNAVISEGTPKLLEHNAICWMKTSEVDNYAFCPADVDILRKLKMVDNALQANLVSLADAQYKEFQCALMPTVDPATVLGVRTPALRSAAKQLDPIGLSGYLWDTLPHKYYEENNLHGLLICQIKDFDLVVKELDRFLPFVDNWATCDLLAPRCFQNHQAELLPHVKRWLSSRHTYTVRFAIGVLMRCYLDARFSPDFLALAAAVDSDEYYVNMMIAWFFATALCKQYDAAVAYLRGRKLKPWIHRKTIQKAIESNRISPEIKAYLRTLK